MEKSSSDEKWDSGRAFVGIIILGVGVMRSPLARIRAPLSRGKRVVAVRSASPIGRLLLPLEAQGRLQASS